jgi:hypothetical protein
MQNNLGGRTDFKVQTVNFCFCLLLDKRADLIQLIISRPLKIKKYVTYLKHHFDAKVRERTNQILI